MIFGFIYKISSEIRISNPGCYSTFGNGNVGITIPRQSIIMSIQDCDFHFRISPLTNETIALVLLFLLSTAFIADTL